MLENTCPHCNAQPGMSCTLPNGTATGMHNKRNLAVSGGRYSVTLEHALALIDALGEVTAPVVATSLNRERQLNNVSDELRTLVKAGHLARVGKSGGRYLYGLTE